MRNSFLIRSSAVASSSLSGSIAIAWARVTGLAGLFGIRAEPGVVEVLTGSATVDQAMVPITGYHMFVLAAASIRSSPRLPRSAAPQSRFIIAIPAHDEEAVIADTVRRLLQLDYTSPLFSIHLVADQCQQREPGGRGQQSLLVDPQFLRIMDAHLARCEQVIQ